MLLSLVVVGHRLQPMLTALVVAVLVVTGVQFRVSLLGAVPLLRLL
jgi:hypothetical protein